MNGRSRFGPERNTPDRGIDGPRGLPARYQKSMPSPVERATESARAGMEAFNSPDRFAIEHGTFQFDPWTQPKKRASRPLEECPIWHQCIVYAIALAWIFIVPDLACWAGFHALAYLWTNLRGL